MEREKENKKGARFQDGEAGILRGGHVGESFRTRTTAKLPLPCLSGRLKTNDISSRFPRFSAFIFAIVARFDLRKGYGPSSCISGWTSGSAL